MKSEYFMALFICSLTSSKLFYKLNGFIPENRSGGDAEAGEKLPGRQCGELQEGVERCVKNNAQSDKGNDVYCPNYFLLK